MSDSSHAKGFTNRSLFFLWAGAAISVAEILGGSALASLGMAAGLRAILVGHLVGGVLLYFAALMSSTLRTSAMESTRFSYGKQGSYLFSGLNILQLVGWTSIMMLQGSRILDQVTTSLYGYSNPSLWMIAIAVGISLWLVVLSRHRVGVNGVVVILLLILGLFLALRLLHGLPSVAIQASWPQFTFWQGVELNIAMSLSWLPLIGDYTQDARQKRSGPLWSAIGYSIVGSCMFALGLGLSLGTGSSDIAMMLTISGFGLASLFIVFFSTVTTTYLDVYSACDSFLNIVPSGSHRSLSLVVTCISLLLAFLVPLDTIEPFLYLIGAVFSPLYAIVLSDYYILRRASSAGKPWDWENLGIWVAGVILYFLMQKLLVDVSNSLLIFLVIGSAKALFKRRHHGA